MVDFYLDERTISSLAEMRAARKQANEEAYLHDLINAIHECKAQRGGFANAIKHWIDSLDGRIDASIRRLKIPHVLREALGLSAQDVFLENGSLWSLVKGERVLLLYSPAS